MRDDECCLLLSFVLLSSDAPSTTTRVNDQRWTISPALVLLHDPRRDKTAGGRGSRRLNGWQRVLLGRLLLLERLLLVKDALHVDLPLLDERKLHGDALNLLFARARSNVHFSQGRCAPAVSRSGRREHRWEGRRVGGALAGSSASTMTSVVRSSSAVTIFTLATCLRSAFAQ